MSAITPSTNVKLLKLPLELDNENQLTFSSVSAQYSYFNSLPSLAANNFTYQRKDGVIRFPGCIDDLLQYNYVMYQNSAFGNKWFYAYIDKMTFVSPEMTDISIRTDAFQTWQFDITFLESFVEREHVDDDTIGKHTVDEGVATGEYMINETYHFDLIGTPPDPLLADEWYVCFVVTNPPKPTDEFPVISDGYEMGSVFTPLSFFAVKSSDNFATAKKVIDYYNANLSGDKTTADAIKNMYMIPYSCVDTSISKTWTNSGTSETMTIYAVKSSFAYFNVAGIGNTNTTVKQDENLYGLYKPHNNKLYTYPYSYIYMNNKSGADVTYKWEEGEIDDTPDEGKTGQEFTFETVIVPSASLSAKLCPIEYKGKRETSVYYGLWNYGINFGKIPLCAWITDYYTNWLTQNGVNNAISIGAGIAGTALGIGLIASGVGAGAGATIIAGASSVVGGGVAIAKSLESNRQASITPDQSAGDTNVGDVSYAYTRNNITAYCMTIRPEHAKIIDNYFDMYGYKVNSVKTPNITGRRNWNYVKTIRGKIHGYIPKEDLNTISGMLDNGVTFWHSPSTFLDYSQTNDII